MGKVTMEQAHLPFRGGGKDLSSDKSFSFTPETQLD
jgi:hypothetical protein